jgi:hypothetical protein
MGEHVARRARHAAHGGRRGRLALCIFPLNSNEKTKKTLQRLAAPFPPRIPLRRAPIPNNWHQSISCEFGPCHVNWSAPPPMMIATIAPSLCRHHHAARGTAVVTATSPSESSRSLQQASSTRRSCERTTPNGRSS